MKTLEDEAVAAITKHLWKLVNKEDVWGHDLSKGRITVTIEQNIEHLPYLNVIVADEDGWAIDEVQYDILVVRKSAKGVSK